MQFSLSFAFICHLLLPGKNGQTQRGELLKPQGILPWINTPNVTNTSRNSTKVKFKP